MSIVCQLEPAKGRSIVHAALARRQRLARSAASLRGTAHTGRALPLYRIAAQALTHAEPLSRARRIGWEYIVVGGALPALAHLRKTRDGFEYGGLNEGVVPRRLLEAALLAEQRFTRVALEYEPRLLEVPSLRWRALWLHAPRGHSRFVTLSEHGAVRPIRIEFGFAAIVRRIARAQGKRAAAKRKPPNPPRARPPARGSS